MSTIELGARGEEVALAFLLAKGLRLVARNWRYGHKELDLIMEDACFLRVVEVRSLRYPNDVDPFETVGYRKQQLVVRAAEKFACRYKVKKEIVFDIVSIVFKGEHYQLKYIENAFTPQW